MTEPAYLPVILLVKILITMIGSGSVIHVYAGFLYNGSNNNDTSIRVLKLGCEIGLSGKEMNCKNVGIMDIWQIPQAPNVTKM